MNHPSFKPTVKKLKIFLYFAQAQILAPSDIMVGLIKSCSYFKLGTSIGLSRIGLKQAFSTQTFHLRLSLFLR